MNKQYAQDILDDIVRRFPATTVKINRPHRLYLTVARAEAHSLARYLFENHGCRLATATGIDTRRGVEIIYHFSHDATGTFYNVKTHVPNDDLKIKSLTDFLAAADWIEREIRELLGVDFTGHPNPAPLLTPEDWPDSAYPLRRDFADPDQGGK